MQQFNNLISNHVLDLIDDKRVTHLKSTIEFLLTWHESY